MKRISPTSFQQIIDALSMEEVIGQYVRLENRGDRLWGLSPFKQEKTPSFSVDPYKKLYYCFSTNQGGTMIDFIMKVEQCQFLEAVHILAQRAGIALEHDGEEVNEEYKYKQDVLALYAHLQKAWQYTLYNTEDGTGALQYIHDRGFSHDIIKKFCLGFAPVDPYWLYKFLLKKGYSAQFLQKTYLFSKKNTHYSVFHNRIIFPIVDHIGVVIGFGGRALEAEQSAKYLNSPEMPWYQKKAQLYGFFNAKDAIKKENSVVVVEGYLDVLAAQQLGMHNVVAPLGTALTEQQLQLINRYTRNVVFAFDNDEAGMRACERGLILCERLEMNASVMMLMAGVKDIGDYVQQDNIQLLWDAYKQRITSFDFLYRYYLGERDSTDFMIKQEISEKLFEYIYNIPSAMRQEFCLQTLANAISIDYRTLLLDFNRKKGYYSKEHSKKDEEQHEIYISLSLLLLLLCVLYPKQWSTVVHWLKVDDMRDEWAYKAWKHIENEQNSIINSENTEQKRLELFLTIFTDEYKSALIQKIVSKELAENEQELVHDIIFQIKKRILEQQEHQIVRDLQDVTVDTKKLLQEKIYIKSMIEMMRKELYGK